MSIDTDRAPRAGRDVWIEEGRKLQGVLGYTFRDPHLLHQALTVTAHRRDPRSHQRFALVGDAAVALYVLTRLVDEHPDWTPAMLDRAKGKLVSNSHLGHIARQMGLTPYVIRPKRVRVRWWTLASVLEAILWAIFADSGEDFGALARALGSILPIELPELRPEIRALPVLTMVPPLEPKAPAPEHAESSPKPPVPRWEPPPSDLDEMTAEPGHAADVLVLLEELRTDPEAQPSREGEATALIERWTRGATPFFQERKVDRRVGRTRRRTTIVDFCVNVRGKAHKLVTGQGPDEALAIENALDAFFRRKDRIRRFLSSRV